MRCVFTIFLIAVSPALTTPAGSQQPAEPPKALPAPRQAVAVEPVARDDEIKQRIEKILTATGWYENIRVAVNDSVVFLDGTTQTEERKIWARELAAKTQDVAAVVNRIAVQPDVKWTFEPALAEMRALGRAAITAMPLFVLALIILPISWYAAIVVSRATRRLMSDRIPSSHLRNVIARAVAVPVFLLGLYLVLQVAGLTQLAVSVIGGAGLLGIIFGLAFREIAENFLASLLLSIRRPFRSGDLISVGEHRGIVQSMNTRSTVLLSTEGNHVQIPNASVFKGVIVNYSTAPARREALDVGIGYDVSIAHAQSVIGSLLESHDAVIDEPAPLVLVHSLGSATVHLRVYYWFDGGIFSAMKLKSALLRLIKKALIENGISMPDEAREIIFPQGVPVIQADTRVAEPLASAGQPSDGARDEVEENGDEATITEGNLANEKAEIQDRAGDASYTDETIDLLREDQ